MRTTIDLPEPLITEARRLSGTKTKTQTVILALQKFIDSKKLEELRQLRGKLPLKIDLDRLRHDRLRLAA